MHCSHCKERLPRLTPTITHSLTQAPGHWIPVPDENGTLHVCLGCAPKMVEFCDKVMDDHLTAQLWVEANNRAWAQVEPELDFLRQDYRRDTV